MATAEVQERSRAAVGGPALEVLAPPALRQVIEVDTGEVADLLAAPVPREMTAYRGLSSVEAGFGVSEPDAIHPGPHPIPGYLVLAHGRFLGMPGVASAPDTGAAIECRIPAGARALWLAGVGDPSTLDGADLILLDSPLLRITGHRLDGPLPVITAEVLPPRR